MDSGRFRQPRRVISCTKLAWAAWATRWRRPAPPTPWSRPTRSRRRRSLGLIFFLFWRIWADPPALMADPLAFMRRVSAAGQVHQSLVDRRRDLGNRRHAVDRA